MGLDIDQILEMLGKYVKVELTTGVKIKGVLQEIKADRSIRIETTEGDSRYIPRAQVRAVGVLDQLKDQLKDVGNTNKYDMAGDSSRGKISSEDIREEAKNKTPVENKEGYL